ncbi:MAG: porin family protein [Chitinophagaceae bacterium]
MKPFPALVCLLMANLISTISNAQPNAFTFGVHAGFNLSSANIHTDYDLGKTSSKPGFQAGVNADWHFNRSFSLQSGLSFTTKGVKQKGSELWIGGTGGTTTYYTNTINQQYLQLPLRIAYQPVVNHPTKFFIHAGPYIAYGIGGKETMEETTKPATASPDQRFVVHTFEKEQRRRGSYHLKRLDYGLSAGLGILYQRFVLSAGYELGLSDIGKINNYYGNYPPAYVYKNRNLYLTVGYGLW